MLSCISTALFELNKHQASCPAEKIKRSHREIQYIYIYGEKGGDIFPLISVEQLPPGGVQVAAVKRN